MKNSVNPAGLSVAEQFVDFLNSQELFRPENANCESCGSKMHYKEFQFWLAGTGMSWSIRSVHSCPVFGIPKPASPIPVAILA